MTDQVERTRSPGVTLAVGVTGHRDFEPQARDPLEAKVRVVLKQIRTAVQCVVKRASELGYEPAANGGKVQLRILSALARGADQLITRVATDLGYELFAVLPCEVGQYADNDDFTKGDSPEDVDSRVKAREFLQKQNEKTLPGKATLVLDGKMAESADLSARRCELESHAAAGDVILENCDILVAILDLDRGNGRSESVRLAQKALQEGIPVVWIETRAPHRIRVCAGRAHTLSEGTMLSEESHDPSKLPETETVVEALLIPPDLRSEASVLPPRSRRDAPETETDTAVRAADRKEKRKKATRDLRLKFLSERAPKSRWTAPFSWVYKAVWERFYAWMAVWSFALKKRHKEDRPQHPTLDEALRRVETKACDATDQPTARHWAVDEGRNRFEPDFRWADGLSNHYMALYRTSFFVNYVLGALAVTSALLSYVSGEGGWGAAFLFTELIVLAVLSVNYLWANWGRWHERATDYRFLAELFRHQVHLAPLGRVTPFPRSPGYHADDARGTWMTWYFRARVREAAPIATTVKDTLVEACTDAFRDDLILDQYNFHKKTSERYERLDERLEWAMRILFVLTAVVVVLHLLPRIGHAHDSEKSLFRTICEGLEACGALLTLLAAALPAWAAATHAINTQAESRRLAARYAGMAAALEEYSNRLKDPAKDATLGAAEAPKKPANSRELAAIMHRAVSLMLAEVTDWREVYRAPRTVLP